MKTPAIFDELFKRVNFFRKGFRIHLEKKPETEEEIMFEIGNYQCDRPENYSFIKGDSGLVMIREGIEYQIEVIEFRRTLLFPQPKFGVVAGTWVIDVTEIKKRLP